MIKAVLLLGMSIFALSACTHYTGITQGPKEDTYYILTNTHIFGIHPEVLYCTGAGGGNLDCRNVDH